MNNYEDIPPPLRHGIPMQTMRTREAKVIEELEIVVLTRDIPEHALSRGDMGAVVHSYKDGAAFDVEFVAGGLIHALGSYKTVTLLTPVQQSRCFPR